MSKYAPKSAREEAREEAEHEAYEERLAEAREHLSTVEPLRVVLEAMGLDYDSVIEHDSADLPLYRAIAEVYAACNKSEDSGILSGACAIVAALEKTLEKMAEARANG